jgi:DNA-binding response OmpR family regulator
MMKNPDFNFSSTFPGRDGRNRILVSDSDPFVANLIEKVLSLYLGLDIIKTHKGSDAITEALSGAFDAAIIDVVSPKGAGIKAICTIKTMMPEFPILALTEEDSEIGFRNLKRLGVADMLIKPFKMSELIEKVNQLWKFEEMLSVQSQLI